MKDCCGGGGERGRGGGEVDGCRVWCERWEDAAAAAAAAADKAVEVGGEAGDFVVDVGGLVEVWACWLFEGC